ncbi:MAG: hypothetical protein ABTR92_02965 [Candidatus Accumulibacter phosphatis]|jgi:hypothetical protein|uniref:hypothetical protein n=1 Tax=Candidatus Accumulibacter sp. ACC012 TaxID=2823332 RepID=UPI0025C683C7|nr:hypothetical protein [Candidatus Accumulibacter sp. ACC012]
MSLKEDVGEGRNGLIILKMVINMNEAQLRTIEQIDQFLSGSALIELSTATAPCPGSPKTRRKGSTTNGIRALPGSRTRTSGEYSTNSKASTQPSAFTGR